MIRGQNLPAITQIADSDVLIVDSASGGTRKITYAQLCQAVKQTLGIREVIDSVNITEDGYLMGGKVIADEFAKLNNDMQMHYLHGTGCSVWYNAFIVILQLDITNATINAGINRFNMLALPKELKLKSANFARYVLNTLSSGWAPDGNQIYLSFDSESQSPYVQATGGKSLTNVQIQDIIIFPTNFFD